VRLLGEMPQYFGQGALLNLELRPAVLCLERGALEFEQSLLKREVPPEHGPKLANPQERQQRGPLILQERRLHPSEAGGQEAALGARLRSEVDHDISAPVPSTPGAIDVSCQTGSYSIPTDTSER
jgi:hypothetical protein